MLVGANRSTAVAVILLAFATLLAYANSFSGPFVFDDRAAILENPSIRRLGALSDVLSPPAGGQSVSGRPLVNLSLALNYAVGGASPLGYHGFNLLVHVLAGLTLFGIARRTIARSNLADANATLLGAVIAALWMLHPLQTAAVTYVVQRAESLMGLFYLLTVYLFIRGCDSPRPWRWWTFATGACFAGVATKEVMATAPLLVLLYDRTFLAGSFAQAWRRRRSIYLVLASTWVLLAVLMGSSGGRGGTVGTGLGISPWQYLLTQCEAIATYLQRALWPRPLVFDYGEYVVGGLPDVAAPALLLIGLLVGSIVALVRWPIGGFFGASFFLILAPTSSVVPIASQTIAEHRMYLPLATVVAGLTIGMHRLISRWAFRPLLLLALACGGLTFARNEVFRSEAALWADTVAHRPSNIRARLNLGSALLDAGRLEEAANAFEGAQRLRRDIPEVHANLCQLYARLGRFADAVAHGETAVRLQPNHADAHINLAAVLAQVGRSDEAIEHYRAARRIQPEAADLRQALADLLVSRAQSLVQNREFERASQHAAEALQAAPQHVEALFFTGNLSASRQDFSRAITRYRQVLQLAPDHVAARNNLANVLLLLGRTSEAAAEYREVLRLRPGDPGVRENLQRALEMQGRAR